MPARSAAGGVRDPIERELSFRELDVGKCPVGSGSYPPTTLCHNVSKCGQPAINPCHQVAQINLAVCRDADIAQWIPVVLPCSAQPA